MDFEWDEAKRDINFAKHGIDFVRAITIWQRPVIDPAGTRDLAGEQRVLALGIIGEDELIVAVVYVLRGETRRLISARRGRRNERAHYQSQFGRGR